MAYQFVPSCKWQEILDITDEYEQGKAATEYVHQLEEEINRLKRAKSCNAKSTKMSIIDDIMKCKPFSEWLKHHDEKIKNDINHSDQNWTGLQSGF